MLQKYTNNIAWLYKMVQPIKGASKTPTWETEGTIFFCDKTTRNSTIANPMANTYTTDVDVVIKTTYQLNFVEGDRITFKQYPKNDVNNADFDIIKSVQSFPYQPKGSKHRAVEYYEHRITLT